MEHLYNNITVAKDAIAAWTGCSIGTDATPDSNDERDIIAKFSPPERQKAQKMLETAIQA